MIDRRSLNELVDKEPFEPFRIHMSDGHAFEVVDPSVVVPMDSKLFIALPGDAWKFLSYRQMTRVESMELAR